MSDEEKKAIKILKEDIEVYKEKGVWKENSIFIKSLRTILNLIEKQQAEIEKKDMIIDRMTTYIMKHSSVPTLRHRFCPNYKKEECRINCKDTIMKSKCIIEYFTNKVEGAKDEI